MNPQLKARQLLSLFSPRIRQAIPLGVLCLAAAGCSVSTGGTASAPVPGGGNGVMPSGDGGTGGTMPGSGGNGTGTSAGDGGGGGDGGTTGPAPGECSLTGRSAVRIEANVSWDAKTLLGFVPVVDAGRGKLIFTVMVDYAQQGNVLTGSLRTCDATMPTFISGALGESYSVYFDPAVWDSGLPASSLTALLSCSRPGCEIAINPVHVQLGEEMADPTATWPEDRKQLDYVDHDGDGVPGIALQTLGPGTGNEYPPVELPGLLTDPRRADVLSLGIRVIAGLDGTLETCERLSGAAPVFSVHTHAAACKSTTAPETCSGDEVTFLDDNLPQWELEEASFISQRVADNATCEDVRRVAAQLALEAAGP